MAAALPWSLDRVDLDCGLRRRLQLQLTRTGVIAVGFAATLAAGAAGFTLGLLFALSCTGSDVSTASDSVLCSGPAELIVSIGGSAVSLAIPFAGMAYALQRESWKPLWLACGAAVLVLWLLLVLALSV